MRTFFNQPVQGDFYLISTRRDFFYKAKLGESLECIIHYFNKIITFYKPYNNTLNLLGFECHNITKKDFKQTVKDKLKEIYNSEGIRFIIIQPGTFFPRIYRPILSTSCFGYANPLTAREEITQKIHKEERKENFLEVLSIDKNDYISKLRQLNFLFEELENVFKVVEPTSTNIKIIYGYKIRDIILLACTQIDSMWNNIFISNDFNPKLPNTNDYYQFQSILKLNEYSLYLSKYKGLGVFSPFSKWAKNRPTQSLKWYCNYNETKHDNETNFKKATLENAVNAVTAVAILIYAQYGENEKFDYDRVTNYYMLTKLPYWNIYENYIPSLYGQDWYPQKYPFKAVVKKSKKKKKIKVSL